MAGAAESEVPGRLRYVLVGEGPAWRLLPSLALVALGVGAAAMGATDLWEAARLRPRAMTCAEWLAAPLEVRWVSLTGCRLDLASASSRTWRRGRAGSDGGVGGARTLQLFLPIAASDERETPPRAVLATTDGELLLVVDALARVAPEEVDAFIDAHRATLEAKLMPAPLTGYVEPIASVASRSALATMAAQGAVVLEHGRRPAIGNALFGALIGLGMIAGALWPMLQRYRHARG